MGESIVNRLLIGRYFLILGYVRDYFSRMRVKEMGVFSGFLDGDHGELSQPESIIR